MSTDRAAQIMELRMLGWQLERVTRRDRGMVIHVAWRAVNGSRTITFTSTYERDVWTNLIVHLNTQKDHDNVED